MSLPKVLIFTVIYDKKDYCLDEFIDNIQEFTYKNREHIFIDNTNDNGEYIERLKSKLEPLGIKVYHTSRGRNSREALARSQNLARDIFLKGDYDYLLSLESDIFPKPNIIDVLLLAGVDVITGLYMIGFKENNTRIPCITIYERKEETGTTGTRLLYPDEFMDYVNQGIKKVAAGGMGCCLMYRKAVEQIPFTFIPGLRPHSDAFWFNDANRLGFGVYTNTDVLCQHKNSDWDKVKDR